MLRTVSEVFMMISKLTTIEKGHSSPYHDKCYAYNSLSWNEYSAPYGNQPFRVLVFFKGGIKLFCPIHVKGDLWGNHMINIG